MTLIFKKQKNNNHQFHFPNFKIHIYFILLYIYQLFTIKVQDINVYI